MHGLFLCSLWAGESAAPALATGPFGIGEPLIRTFKVLQSVGIDGFVWTMHLINMDQYSQAGSKPQQRCQKFKIASLNEVKKTTAWLKVAKMLAARVAENSAVRVAKILAARVALRF